MNSTMRDLKELHWRSRGPRLPQTVLDAATLRIGAPLPDTYRLFLSQVDGGKIGRGAFKAADKDWLIGGFFPFADAAGVAEKLRKSGKLPTGYLPVAYGESPEKPLVYLELSGAGRMFLKPSLRTRWEEAGAVQALGESFAEFLDLLGDAPKDGSPVNGESLAPAPVADPASATRASGAPAPQATTARTSGAPAPHAPAPARSAAVARPAAAKPVGPAKPVAKAPGTRPGGASQPAPNGARPITAPAAAAARAVTAAAAAKVVKPAARPAPAAKAKAVAKARPAKKPAAKKKAAAKAKAKPKARARARR